MLTQIQKIFCAEGFWRILMVMAACHWIQHNVTGPPDKGAAMVAGLAMGALCFWAAGRPAYLISRFFGFIFRP